MSNPVNPPPPRSKVEILLIADPANTLALYGKARCQCDVCREIRKGTVKLVRVE